MNTRPTEEQKKMRMDYVRDNATKMTRTELGKAFVKKFDCNIKTATNYITRAMGPRVIVPDDTDAPTSGIKLSGVRTATQKPPATEAVKRKIYLLKKGMAFPIGELSIKWGVSDETIKKYAKKFDCFRYVERAPGDWVSCVIHPDSITEG